MTENTNNIVQFPRNKIVRDPSLNTEELNKIKEKSLINFADSLTQEITENILVDFDNSGIDIETETFTKDFHFLVGVLTATIYRTMDIEHELHDFIDQRVKIYKTSEFLNSTPDTIEFDKLEDLDNPIT